MEGHHAPIQHSKHTCQFQCPRTLYVGPPTQRTNIRSPVACSSGTNSDLWGVTSGVVQGTYVYVCAACALIPWKFLQRLWFDRLPLPTKCHW